MPAIELPSVAGTAGLIGTGHKEDELGNERNAMFRSMTRTDGKTSKRGVNKLILSFAALVATAIIGTTGVAGATPSNGNNGNNGHPGNHNNSHNQTGNLNQGMQLGGDGYGGGNVNIGVNIGLNNSNNNTIIIILRPIINIIR